MNATCIAEAEAILDSTHWDADRFFPLCGVEIRQSARPPRSVLCSELSKYCFQEGEERRDLNLHIAKKEFKGVSTHPGTAFWDNNAARCRREQDSVASMDGELRRLIDSRCNISHRTESGPFDPFCSQRSIRVDSCGRISFFRYRRQYCLLLNNVLTLSLNIRPL